MIKKVLVIISILLLSCACSNSYFKNISLKNLDKKLDDKETFILYLTDEEEGKTLKNTLEKVVNKNKLNSYYLNTNKLNDNDLKSLKEIFMFDETNLILFIKNGKEETVLSRVNDIYMSENNLEQELKAQGFIK